MAMKTTSLRLPDDLISRLTENGQKMLNPTIIEFVEQSLADRKAALLDIKGIFTPEEWTAIADSLNGTMMTDPFWYSREAFVAHCEDAELYDSTFSRHKAEVSAVCEKAKSLTGIQIATIYRRVADFWDKCTKTDLKAWSRF